MLIVGLGNPGLEYLNTRHNVGFWCVDAIAAHHDFTWQKSPKMLCSIASGFVADKKLILIKPTTYMNLSGQSVILVQNYYKIDISKTIVVHDDLDLECGIIRYKMGGGAGGHNGIKSIDQLVGNLYHRIRIGIGNAEHSDASSHVLGQIMNSERKLIDQSTDCVIKNILHILSENFEHFKTEIAEANKHIKG